MKPQHLRSTVLVREGGMVIGHVYEWWTGMSWNGRREEARVFEDYEEAKRITNELRDHEPPLSDRYGFTLLDTDRG